MSLQIELERMNEDRVKVEAAINKLIDDFEAKHNGAFVSGIEQTGGTAFVNDFKLIIEISII